MTIVYKEFPTDITSKANPVDADILLIADSEDNNEMKKITIGSITQDIGDGLIVDGSASSTTTYSSTKINTDNATQDAALTAGLALKVAKAGDNMTGLFKEAQSTNIASATTTGLSAATGNSVTITGTTTITGLGTVQAGTTIKATFSGILTLTHNATSLILPNAGTNITTAAGDTAIFVSLGSGNWKCINYTRADGTSLAAVSVVGLTEDTTGDMDNDFVLAYDASATANRKQKISVFRSSDAEAIAGTSNTKFITPAQLFTNTAYSVNTNIGSTYWTQQIPINVTSTSTATGWNYAGAGGNALDVNAAASYINVAGTTSCTLSSRIMGATSSSTYQYNSTKIIRLKGRMNLAAGGGGGNIWGFGFVLTAAHIFTAHTDTNAGEVRFVNNNGTLYAQNANGTSATYTDVTGGRTLTDWHVYEIILTPSTSILFYIDGTLVATHTTNIPTNASDVLLTYGVSGNGRSIQTQYPIISIQN